MCEYARMVVIRMIMMLMMMYFSLQYQCIVEKIAYAKSNQVAHSSLIGRCGSSSRVCFVDYETLPVVMVFETCVATDAEC